MQEVHAQIGRAGIRVEALPDMDKVIFVMSCAHIAVNGVISCIGTYNLVAGWEKDNYARAAFGAALLAARSNELYSFPVAPDTQVRC